MLFTISKTCSGGFAIADSGLKKTTYPFDWLGQPIKTVSHILDNGIEHLLEDYEISYPDENGRIIQVIWDKTYNMLFTHEVSANIDEIREKFIRRYNRLINDLRNSETVVLIHATSCENSLWEHWNRWRKHFKSKIPNKSVDDNDIGCVVESILKINPEIKIQVVKSSIYSDVVDDIQKGVFEELITRDT
jgi:hypothetical protein